MRDRLLKGEGFRALCREYGYSQPGMRDAMARAGWSVVDLAKQHRRERYERIVGHLKGGATMQQAGEVEGLSKEGVYKTLRAHGYTAKNHQRTKASVRAARRQRTAAMLAEGLNTVEIAKNLGVSQFTAAAYATEIRGKAYHTYTLPQLNRIADALRHGKSLSEASKAEGLNPACVGAAMRLHLGLSPKDLIKEFQRDRREFVIQLRRAGKTLSEIDELVTVSPTTISKWCRESFGSTRRRPTGTAKQQLDARVMELHREGVSHNEIAKAVNRAPSTIGKIVALHLRQEGATVTG